MGIDKARNIASIGAVDKEYIYALSEVGLATGEADFMLRYYTVRSVMTNQCIYMMN